MGKWPAVQPDPHDHQRGGAAEALVIMANWPASQPDLHDHDGVGRQSVQVAVLDAGEPPFTHELVELVFHSDASRR
jgi:hypothetical protein